jgi:hypothetical protein
MKTKHLIPLVLLFVCALVVATLWLGRTTARAQNGIVYVSQSPTAPYSTFKYPTGLTISLGANNSLDFYIADTGNNVIRYWNSLSGGSPTVLAGNGSAGYVDGTLSSSEFSSPTGLWGGTYSWLYQYGCGGGRKCTITYYYTKLYVNDTGNHVVRLVCSGSVPSGCTSGTVTTVAGNGTDGYVNGSSLSAEFGGLAGDRYGSEWYFFDMQNNTIRGWNGSSVTTWAGTGQAGLLNGYITSAEFGMPASAAWDTNSNMYVTDMANYVLRKIDPSGSVTTLAGSGQAGYADGTGGAAEFNLPTVMAFNSSDGHLYVADSGNNMVRRVDTSGNVTTYVGQRSGGYADACGTQAKFATPTEAVAYNGYLYVSDTMNNAIRQVNLSNGCVTTYIH